MRMSSQVTLTSQSLFVYLRNTPRGSWFHSSEQGFGLSKYSPRVMEHIQTMRASSGSHFGGDGVSIMQRGGERGKSSHCQESTNAEEDTVSFHLTRFIIFLSYAHTNRFFQF